LAASAAAVRPTVPRAAAYAHPAARWTVRVESPSPVKERIQYGAISADRERRPRFCHTHRRFSSNDGTVPAPVATTFAHSADRPCVARRMVRMETVTLVEIIDTVAYRASFRRSGLMGPFGAGDASSARYLSYR
jgi:hypothetical protein